MERLPIARKGERHSRFLMLLGFGSDHAKKAIERKTKTFGFFGVAGRLCKVGTAAFSFGAFASERWGNLSIVFLALSLSVVPSCSSFIIFMGV